MVHMSPKDAQFDSVQAPYHLLSMAEQDHGMPCLVSEVEGANDAFFDVGVMVNSDQFVVMVAFLQFFHWGRKWRRHHHPQVWLVMHHHVDGCSPWDVSVTQKHSPSWTDTYPFECTTHSNHCLFWNNLHKPIDIAGFDVHNPKSHHSCVPQAPYKRVCGIPATNIMWFEIMTVLLKFWGRIFILRSIGK